VVAAAAAAPAAAAAAAALPQHSHSWPLLDAFCALALCCIFIAARRCTPGACSQGGGDRYCQERRDCPAVGGRRAGDLGGT
jgi:hypothetical protein